MQGSGFKKALRVEALGSADIGTSAEKKSNMIVVGFRVALGSWRALQSDHMKSRRIPARAL